MTAEPQDLASWVKFLSQAEIPVLKATAREIGRMRANEDSLNPRDVSIVCGHDPMMAFRILRYMQTHKNKNQLQDLVLVEQAIMMMGLSTFFKNIPPVPLVEDTLKGNLPALMHLLKLIHRINRAAHLTFEFGLVLSDIHVQENRVAALLHDLSEVLMWCFAPDKMMQIYQMQHADKTIRSHHAQEQVFGFNFAELQINLVEACQLPSLLKKLMDEHAANDQRVKTVLLSVNVARHSANGWDDAALPDDYKDIATLLRIDAEKTKRIIGVPEETLW